MCGFMWVVRILKIYCSAQQKVEENKIDILMNIFIFHIFVNKNSKSFIKILPWKYFIGTTKCQFHLLNHVFVKNY